MKTSCKSPVTHLTLSALALGAGLLALASFPATAGAECVPSGKTYLPGDIVADNHVNVSDLQCYLLTLEWETNSQAGPAPHCTAGNPLQADFDCDSITTLVDVQMMVQLVVGKPLHVNIDADQDKCPDSCQLGTCGNGFCDGTEQCFNCSQDCGVCPGDCCSAHGSPGCDNEALQACVCSSDAFCCSTSWDESCVDGAISFCGQCWSGN